MIVPKKWLTKIELNKIKAECKDECCNPAGSSASATSPAILRWINAPISEAATEHSEIRRLLNLADENSKSSEAATEHSKIPEAACLEAKRPKKSGKGSFSQIQKMLSLETNAKTTNAKTNAKTSAPRTAPPLPPGPHWKRYAEGDAIWFHYDGPLGQWWKDDTMPEPMPYDASYLEEDA